ncbi:MAG: hypothetical protein GXP33_00040 [Spirochaetes bacterium]|nr:hypothetical protein [Spirochaetota bacterium]
MKISRIVFLFLLLLAVVGCASKIPEGTLVSKKVKQAPNVDGNVDKLWDKQPALSINVTVPDYPLFDKSYRGRKYEVTAKSVHDKDSIYFLYQWKGDNSMSLARMPWYFNSDEGKWMQKPKKKADKYYPPVYEDKFAVIWEINNSIPDFKKNGCAILCHGEYKHTPAEGQKADIWHWKLDRTGPVHQLDDKWLKYSEKNGRTADSGTSAYKSNSQVLKKPGGGDVKVPLYWIPGKKNYHWILASDTSKKRIVKIDKDHNLIDEEGTVLKKENYSGDSDQLIPSVSEIKPATGSRGDVTAYYNYDKENKIWTLEVKRAINTGNADDVNFSDSKNTYYFSVAVFNGAAIAHATPGGFAGKSFPMLIQ